ncbi:hypothetical protein ACIRG5_45450 [Lentzea sp. NPDC102401]|uniref:hypothetical protein n=1 Tax=Lentzea sp. NPDC102401 TaxID=3364128 RepID=UPI0037F70EAE
MVAGVAGGVGTSTWVRLWLAAHGGAFGIDIKDHGHYTNGRVPIYVNGRVAAYTNGRVDVLVSSNTAASTSRIGSTLRTMQQLADRNGYHQPPPVLVVMHTVAGAVRTLKADLITVQPHLTTTLHIRHKPEWLLMQQPPGDAALSHKDIVDALVAIPQAIKEMYLGGPATSTPPPTPAVPQSAQMSPGMRHQFPAHQLGLAGGHPAIRAGPPPPHASANGAHHDAMPLGRFG